MTIHPTFYKLFPEGVQPKDDNLNDRINNETRDIVEQLNLFSSTQPIAEYQLIDNMLFLGSGTYGGFTIDKRNTRIKGQGGVKITSPVNILATACHITDLHFYNEVVIDPAASIVFTNCVFDGTRFGVTSGDTLDVAIAAGGTAHFIGCTFLGASSVINAGVVAAVFINSCVKEFVNPLHINVTIIAQTIMP
jgi:hypothetical protein